MILEIVGSRILAPYLGTSIFVWTSLIGIILASLSLGYYQGGKLADSNPSFKTFSLLILFAALFLGFTTVIQGPLLTLIQVNIRDVRFGALIAAMILFAPPSILLGMVSPYAVRLSIHSLEGSGSTVGTLYAISTAGSILGTFAAGFFLLSFFGSINILRILAVVLILTAYLANPPGLKQFVLPIVTSSSLLWGLNNLFGTLQSNRIDIDTMYNRIWVFDSVDKPTQRPIKVLAADNMSSSAIFLDSEDLVFPYTRFYRLSNCFQPSPMKALVIGGGAYSFPRFFVSEFRMARLDVVELDPGQTMMARKYFRLKENPRLKIYHEDGRTFLNRQQESYDVIFMDAFKSLYAIPPHLTTKEAIVRMHALLKPGGLVLLNAISAIEGAQGQFLRAEYYTYKEIFPEVLLFPVQYPDDPYRSQNIILLALKQKLRGEISCPDPVLAGYLKHRWTKEIVKDTSLLTDDFAPVDYYAAAIIKARR